MKSLKAIEGISDDQADRYGQKFIEIARNYSDEKEANMAGTAGESPPAALPTTTIVSKTHSSHFSKGNWIEVSSDEDENTIDDNDGFIVDDDEDEYDQDWDDGVYDEVAAAASSHHFQHQGSSPRMSSAGMKKLNPEQLAWKARFDSQASQAAAARSEPAATHTKKPAKTSDGGTKFRKKFPVKRRSSGNTSSKGGAGGKRASSSKVGKPTTGGRSKNGGGGGGGGGSGRGRSGGPGIRPMGMNYPR